MGLELFSLKDKVAIVTGSGRNIGRAIAVGLAEVGADVVCAARTASEIEQTAAEVKARGRRALALPTDVRVEAQVNALVERTLAQFGRIDILVNHAGGLFVAKTLEMSERAWDALIAENLKGSFLCAKAVAKTMVAGQIKGCIINTASYAAFSPYPVSPAYAAAKAAIVNFTYTLAVELAPYQIRVNAFAPGMIYHASSSFLFHADDPERQKVLLQKVPLGRFGKPEDIVGAVIFLASPAASYITGATIPITGGQLSW